MLIKQTASLFLRYAYAVFWKANAGQIGRQRTPNPMALKLGRVRLVMP